MPKKRTRHQNPEPFLFIETKSSLSHKRSKPPKIHQRQQELIPTGMSSKILKEAIIQQREIQDEVEAQNPNPNSLVFNEEPAKTVQLEEEDDIDDFDGFLETQSQYGGNEMRLNQYPDVPKAMKIDSKFAVMR